MILWPFFPNWKDSYKETWSYLTEVLTSDAGREQRRSWRALPRRKMEYSAVAKADRYRAFRKTTRRQDETIVFPDEVRRHRSTGAVVGGSFVVSFPTPQPAWMVAGRQVIFEAPLTRLRAVRTVQSVASGVVTFVEAADRAWPANTRVMPALTGTLPESIKNTIVTDDLATLPVNLMVEPGTDFVSYGEAVTTFRGLEVLTHRPNWANGVNLESTIGRQWVDNEVGVRQASNPIDFGTDVYQANHLLRNPAHFDEVLGLFHRMSGRQGEFFAPTWASDIKLLSTTAAGGDLFTVDGFDFYDAYNDDTVYRCFCVRMQDDTLHFFRIESMSKPLSGTPRTLVTTTADAPVDINMGNVKSISWMPVRRFASDDLVLDWVTDTTAEVVVNTQALEDFTT